MYLFLEDMRLVPSLYSSKKYIVYFKCFIIYTLVYNFFIFS